MIEQLLPFRRQLFDFHSKRSACDGYRSIQQIGVIHFEKDIAILAEIYYPYIVNTGGYLTPDRIGDAIMNRFSERPFVPHTILVRFPDEETPVDRNPCSCGHWHISGCSVSKSAKCGQRRRIVRIRIADSEKIVLTVLGRSFFSVL